MTLPRDPKYTPKEVAKYALLGGTVGLTLGVFVTNEIFGARLFSDF